MSDESFEQFTTVLASIPSGRYTSYGALAKLCGVHVRQVQAWLRRLPSGTHLPWHRIINSQRKITDHAGASEQKHHLLNEGLIPNASGRYPLDQYWP